MHQSMMTEEMSQTITCRHEQPSILVYENHAQDSRIKQLGDCCSALTARCGTGGNNLPLVVENECYIRKLMPIECERLMGFPDDHTRIPWRGKSPEECPDNHRYKAIGNSMTVNVLEAIGIGINRVEYGK